ncbi:unnamed protein product [Angiostrongylus costaricensis]|uniref:Uncharacterized protein n=1 Tax=Angiostrongylus costaricensis TaxID=334426 RepID=A0A158PFS5_ANGCS|nr:unnamed protein product [Angiostrongylus costaricensis]
MPFDVLLKSVNEASATAGNSGVSLETRSYFASELAAADLRITRRPPIKDVRAKTTMADETREERNQLARQDASVSTYSRRSPLGSGRQVSLLEAFAHCIGLGRSCPDGVRRILASQLSVGNALADLRAIAQSTALAGHCGTLPCFVVQHPDCQRPALPAGQAETPAPRPVAPSRPPPPPPTFDNYISVSIHLTSLEPQPLKSCIANPPKRMRNIHNLMIRTNDLWLDLDDDICSSDSSPSVSPTLRAPAIALPPPPPKSAPPFAQAAQALFSRNLLKDLWQRHLL